MRMPKTVRRLTIKMRRWLVSVLSGFQKKGRKKPKYRLTPLGKAVVGIFVLALILVIALPIVILNTKNRKVVSTPVQVEVTTIPRETGWNLSIREREDMVYGMLLKEGFSPAGACGIMGNISVECTSFDPTVLGNNGMTFGLFQWNDVGDRRERLKRWCSDRHIRYDTIIGQIQFATYEIEGGDSIACRLEEYLKTTDNAYTAAMEFTAGFERCVTKNTAEKGKYVGNIYPGFYGLRYQSMEKRISRALNYYDRYVVIPANL